MDLTTSYLGMTLGNPVVASASPLSGGVDGVRRLSDAGVGAIVLPSLFEEQLRREEVEDDWLTEAHDGVFNEAQTYFPQAPTVDLGGVRSHLHFVEQAVAASEVPVIASLNGSTPGGWTAIARGLQDAGAAAVELNIYAVPGDDVTSGAEVEQRHVEIVRSVREAIDVPLAVKLSPYFSATGALVRSLVDAGADGLVLFNRFLQPDIDIERLAVVPSVSLSTPGEARLPRTWMALLHGRIDASLAATTGVETSDDVVAYLLAGADVVMTASALLRHGPEHARVLIDGLDAWLTRRGYDTSDAIRGLLAVPADQDAAVYERTGYVSALQAAREHYGSLA